MAKSLEVLIPTGSTCTAKLFATGSDTVVETIGTLTEATNRKGTAVGTIASATGWNKVVLFNGSQPVGDFVVYIGSTDPATYIAVDDAPRVAIKSGTALASFPFLMTDSTNHLPATGKTVSVTRSIDGGAFGAGTLSSVTELGNGVYLVSFAAADLTGTNILLRATAAACDDTFERITTQP